jgi:hypothetical protein
MERVPGQRVDQRLVGVAVALGEQPERDCEAIISWARDFLIELEGTP